MSHTYHTYCANCDTKHHLILDSNKESTRCKNCGVYMYDSYDEVCDYLDGGGDEGIICELCQELQLYFNNIKNEFHLNYNKYTTHAA